MKTGADFKELGSRWNSSNSKKKFHLFLASEKLEGKDYAGTLKRLLAVA